MKLRYKILIAPIGLPLSLISYLIQGLIDCFKEWKDWFTKDDSMRFK